MAGNKMAHPSDRVRRPSQLVVTQANELSPLEIYRDLEVRGREFLTRLAMYHPDRMVNDWSAAGTDAPVMARMPTASHHLERSNVMS
jgi:hypothetical protein